MTEKLKRVNTPERLQYLRKGFAQMGHDVQSAARRERKQAYFALRAEGKSVRAATLALGLCEKTGRRYEKEGPHA